MNLLKLCLVLGCAVGLAACEQPLGIVVSKISPPAKQLRAMAARGAVVTDQASFDIANLNLAAPTDRPAGTAFIGLHFPSGTPGDMQIGIAAFDENNCLLDAGEAPLPGFFERSDSEYLKVELTSLAGPGVSCSSAALVLSSIVQQPDDWRRVTLRGWGFHPQAQVFYDEQLMTTVEERGLTRMVVRVPVAASPSGRLSGLFTVRNPDGTSAVLRGELTTLGYATFDYPLQSLSGPQTLNAVALGDVNGN